jgi:quinol monooxygenase YgiN
MIVVRFKVQCKPEKIEQAMAAFKELITPSRAVEGVVNFDIARDLHDPHSIIATEVFVDRAAPERQESLPAVQKIIGQLPEFLAGNPEATIYNVSSSEPWGS